MMKYRSGCPDIRVGKTKLPTVMSETSGPKNITKTEWGEDMAEQAILSTDSVQDEWGQICSQLKTEVGDTAFESWLKPLTPGTFNDGVMNICVPTRFMRNWVITHYSDRINKIWEKKNPAIKSVNFVVQAIQEESHGLYAPSCRTGRNLF